MIEQGEKRSKTSGPEQSGKGVARGHPEMAENAERPELPIWLSSGENVEHPKASATTAAES
jgi:hypothetical protein